MLYYFCSLLFSVKNAYYEKCKLIHPDRTTGDCEKFQTLMNVYSILANPMKRVLYDANGTINEKPVVFVATDDILAACGASE